MALAQGTEYNMRSTATSSVPMQNGGGYYAARNPVSGINYSLENEAALVLTDISIPYQSRYISSNVGGFTQQMVGNLIYIRGGGAYEGRAEIIEWISANQVKLDTNYPSLSATVVDASGAVGGALSGFVYGMYMYSNNSLGKVWVSGNTTYNIDTYGANLQIPSAQLYQPAMVVGYGDTYAVPASGDERPIIQASGRSLQFTYYITVSGVIFQSGGDKKIAADGNPYIAFRNCKFTYTGETASHAILGTSECFINCEFDSRLTGYGKAISNTEATALARGPLLLGCCVSGLAGGFFSSPFDVHTCIAANMPNGTGISNSSINTDALIMNTDIVNCKLGFNALDTFSSSRFLGVSSIFQDCARAINSNASVGTVYIRNNDYYNCDAIFQTAQVAGVAAVTSSGNTYTDPLFVDASGGNFRVSSASPCLTQGYSPFQLDGTLS